MVGAEVREEEVTANKSPRDLIGQGKDFITFTAAGSY